MNMATSTRPVRARKAGPLTTDYDAMLKRVIKGAHEDVLKEIDRLKRLEIIDDNGRLLKPTRPSGTKSGDFGGWG
jgi:hypothetical protein